MNNKKLVNQNLNSRNNKNLKISKFKTSSKHNQNNKYNISIPSTIEFLYQLEKRKKLNSLKERSNKVSNFMKNLERTVNNNLNKNAVVVESLTKIGFRRSIMIRQKLRKLDKMNNEFDKEYSSYNFNLNNQNNKAIIRYDEMDEEYLKRIKKENSIRKAKFRAESMKIFNLLYNKDKKEFSFSDYKKNKKLSELKSSIRYICGTDKKNQKGSNKNNFNTISHYNDMGKPLSFIREQMKNESFTPSVKYNKANIYFKKKYELINEIMDKDKKLPEKLYNSIQISPNKKVKYKLKEKNYRCKTAGNRNTFNSPQKEDSPNKAFELNNNSKKINSPKKHFSENRIDNLKENLKFNENSELKSLKHRIIFSPKQRHPSLGSSIRSPKKYYTINQKNQNSSTQNNKKRCKTATHTIHSNNNISESYNISKSNKKKINPLIMNLLNDNYKLKDELKFGFSIISNMINDFKNKKKIKTNKKEVNIEKLRKELNLKNMPSIVDEVDVVMNNVKKLENILRKKDVDELRKVAKTVIREDTLANKVFIYESNPLHIKTEKLYQNRNLIKNKNKDIENEGTVAQQERNQMISLFKNDKPDFFNEDYLSNLIKRYKSLNAK